MKVIGVSGLPGSGKSLISNMARKKGFFIIRMGDIIRKEARRLNEDTGKVAVDLRKEKGDFVVAEMCIDKIKHYKKNREKFLIEGIRSPYEVELFKKSFKNFKVISVHSSPYNRFNRIRKRKRQDDSDEYEIFKERDRRELEFGIGNVIALSDEIISNNDGIKKYKSNINSYLNKELQNKNKEKKYKKRYWYGISS